MCSTLNRLPASLLHTWQNSALRLFYALLRRLPRADAHFPLFLAPDAPRAWHAQRTTSLSRAAPTNALLPSTSTPSLPSHTAAHHGATRARTPQPSTRLLQHALRLWLLFRIAARTILPKHPHPSHPHTPHTTTAGTGTGVGAVTGRAGLGVVNKMRRNVLRHATTERRVTCAGRNTGLRCAPYRLPDLHRTPAIFARATYCVASRCLHAPIAILTYHRTRSTTILLAYHRCAHLLSFSTSTAHTFSFPRRDTPRRHRTAALCLLRCRAPCTATRFRLTDNFGRAHTGATNARRGG